MQAAVTTRSVASSGHPRRSGRAYAKLVHAVQTAITPDDDPDAGRVREDPEVEGDEDRGVEEGGGPEDRQSAPQRHLEHPGRPGGVGPGVHRLPRLHAVTLCATPGRLREVPRRS
jgi:hypothetical protein